MTNKFLATSGRRGRGRRASVWGILALGTVACEPLPTTHDAAAADADASISDAGGPSQPPSNPDCHWDCFGGATCRNGRVIANYPSPRPCTFPPGVTAETVCDFASAACPTAQCAPTTPYQVCASRRAAVYAINPPAAADDPLIARVFCEAGTLKRAGATCATDDDCRPAASEHATGLRCDTGTQRCVVRARPPAPDRFGASCGLDLAGMPIGTGTYVVVGATCDLCAVNRNFRGCSGQVCTVACDFDEDCPEGSLCACALPTGAMRFNHLGVCVRAADRDAQAVSAALGCGTAGDAGAPDADRPDAGGPDA